MAGVQHVEAAVRKRNLLPEPSSTLEFMTKGFAGQDFFLAARRSRLYLSIRIGEISSNVLLPIASSSGRERNSSCTHVRLLVFAHGINVSAMKSRNFGASTFLP